MDTSIIQSSNDLMQWKLTVLMRNVMYFRICVNHASVIELY
jgi:hypothetical protein